MWFTADEHFFRRNIIENPKTWGWRKFKNEEECRKKIIENHNKAVHHFEDVYHLGDFAMIGAGQADKLKPILRQLNGIHHLILGNHDELKPQKYVDIGFARVHTSLRLKVDKWILELHHDPSLYNVFINAPEADRIIFLHGHIHRLYKSLKERKTVNVGVDVWNFWPVNLEEILKELELL
jgi:calcineurin-like phosphoesterase family protein